MNTEQIGNKMILEFMGGSILFDGSIHTCPRGGNNKFHDGTTGRKGVNELKYHSSWDWLMPVAKEVKEQLDDILSAYNRGKLKDKRDELHLLIESFHWLGNHFDIEILHKKIIMGIQFIKWYNSTNQEPLTNNL